MEGETKHVYLMVNFSSKHYRGGLFEIQIEQGGIITGPNRSTLEPVVKFFELDKNYPLPSFYLLQAARLPDRVYLLAHEGLSNVHSRKEPVRHSGFVFDTEARFVDTFSPPLASKPKGVVISAYGKLYSLADTECYYCLPQPSFERYDPSDNTWEKLPSFPYSERQESSYIGGYAVCHGCILVSLCDIDGKAEFWAFRIARNTWHKVNFSKEEDRHNRFTFLGRAVVVGDDTIYALSPTGYGTVVSFSFKISSGDDGRTTYSLEKSFLLKSLGDGFRGEGVERSSQSEYLVQLEGLQFCLAQTFDGNLTSGTQHLLITTFEIVPPKMEIKTLHSTRRVVHIGLGAEDCGQFSFYFGFTRECADFEPGGEEISQLKGKAKAKKKRNRHKRKNLNCDTEDSKPEREVSRQPFEHRGKATVLRLLDSHTGELIQIGNRYKLVSTVISKLEDVEPKKKETCQLAMKKGTTTQRSKSSSRVEYGSQGLCLFGLKRYWRLITQ